jgi:hypothetical protein
MLSLQPLLAATARSAPTRGTQAIGAAAAGQGTILRRSIRDVERDMGRLAFETEVRRLGYHLIECGQHYIVICTPDRLKVIC